MFMLTETNCPNCGSPRSLGASLTGPIEYGGKPIRQCVPCGCYYDLGPIKTSDSKDENKENNNQ